VKKLEDFIWDKFETYIKKAVLKKVKRELGNEKDRLEKLGYSPSILSGFIGGEIAEFVGEKIKAIDKAEIEITLYIEQNITISSESEKIVKYIIEENMKNSIKNLILAE